MKGICSKCHQNRQLTKHHIIPLHAKRKLQQKYPELFNNGNNKGYLCWDCHYQIEREIETAEKQNGGLLQPSTYVINWHLFVKGCYP